MKKVEIKVFEEWKKKTEFFFCVRDAKRKEKQNITQKHFEI